MAVDEKHLYRALTKDITGHYVGRRAKPEPKVEEEVARIFTQARRHRSLLLWFYIGYTSVVTIAVMSILIVQAYIRVDSQDKSIELIPQWALNLLVVGMFGQFVGLLTIVTKRVWNFEDFFKHHHHIMNGMAKESKKDDK